jgi:cyclopropane fatty-acyl-phospholipid synthase-like methyltransferase
VVIVEYPESRIRAICDKASNVHPLLSWHAEEALTRMRTYREKAVSSLNLTADSIVLDVACGVGLNFRVIQNHIESNGRIVGVEFSSRTAELAKKLVADRNWADVEIVNMSIMDYEPGVLFDAALCTQAMEITPEAAVDRIFQLLAPHGRFAMIGMKLSSRFPFRLFNPLMEHFAKSGGIDIHRDVYKDIEAKCKEVSNKEFLAGFFYILTTSRSSLTHTMGQA